MKFVPAQVLLPVVSVIDAKVDLRYGYNIMSYSMQARINEGKEPIQFFVIMQSFITFKVQYFYFPYRFSFKYSLSQSLKKKLSSSQGGVSDAFKKYIAENDIPDTTYEAEGVALFRVQGSGPENMQAIQIEAVCVL